MLLSLSMQMAMTLSYAWMEAQTDSTLVSSGFFIFFTIYLSNHCLLNNNRLGLYAEIPS